MYYFEEVEEKRAREREQLAAWYQPIPEPVSPVKPISPPPAPPADVAAVSALAAGVHQATGGQRAPRRLRALPHPAPRRCSARHRAARVRR
jgi:S-DNA-T family DNA segregation ATPase FtsK/SpoIIIE